MSCEVENVGRQRGLRKKIVSVVRKEALRGTREAVEKLICTMVRNSLAFSFTLFQWRLANSQSCSSRSINIAYIERGVLFPDAVLAAIFPYSARSV